MKTMIDKKKVQRRYLATLNLNPFNEVRNHGSLNKYNAHARITGDCGDTMEFWLLVENQVIEHVSYVSDGCAYSQACGKMAACLVEGMTVQQAVLIKPEEIVNLLPGLPPDHEHCALLAANTVRAAVKEYLERRKEILA